ncbi:MgtC/SapB family protein [Anatilimnocola sp. NA78]|uniref:MgtC/SapB family protein n=1 Tax=Anatilimnocola sp. NA78 TaxID=3415683 RepID=UPI003CE51A79
MLSTLELIIRLSVAAVFGAVLGWEREAQNKPAGLRTHILVSLGSAAFMLAGLELNNELVAKGQSNSADILKVVGGIVGGIGFLGAGSIIQNRRGVSGLTTAATIWVAAAVGITSGLGYYRLAAISVVLALSALLALGTLQHGKKYLKADDQPEVEDDAHKDDH